MLPRPHRIRRARRTDFVAVMELLATSGVPVPPADRATLRRFRRIVADLGADLYVAAIDEKIVGIVHVTYARQLTGPARAHVEALLVAPPVRRRGIGSSLQAFIISRACRRGCDTLVWAAPAAASETSGFFGALGWRNGVSFCAKT
jgi:GNAT superfamily N-acetyltransferase